MCNPQVVASATPSRSVPAKAPLNIDGIPGSTLSHVQTKEGKIAASAALVRVSHNLGYFSLGEMDPVLAEKAVTVSTPADSPLNLCLGEIYDELPIRSHLPVYIQVHHNNPERLVLEHLLDNLAETVLGRQNLELKKNVTIDLFDSDGDSHFRDRLGFFVTDRVQFRQLTVSAVEAGKVLAGSNDVVVSKFAACNLQDVLNYDDSLSAQTRDEYVAHLIKQVQCYVARSKSAKAADRDENEKKQLALSGYALVKGERVLALYADSQAAAESLLKQIIKDGALKQFTLASPVAHWASLAALPSTKRRAIYRRHTRAVPANLKWDRIFGMNVGLNLF